MVIWYLLVVLQVALVRLDKDCHGYIIYMDYKHKIKHCKSIKHKLQQGMICCLKALHIYIYMFEAHGSPHTYGCGYGLSLRIGMSDKSLVTETMMFLFMNVYTVHLQGF